MDLVTALYWLSINCFYEARGESRLGQVYVARTVLNRAEKSGKSIEEVVNASYQFSWTAEDKVVSPADEPKAFLQCTESSVLAADFEINSKITHYHEVSARPYWASLFKPAARVGRHIFYEGEETMKKGHKYNTLSTKKCSTPGCDRRIKQNILDRKPSADKCYRCFCAAELKRGNKIISGNKARQEKNLGGNINRASTEQIPNHRSFRSIQ